MRGSGKRGAPVVATSRRVSPLELRWPSGRGASPASFLPGWVASADMPHDVRRRSAGPSRAVHSNPRVDRRRDAKPLLPRGRLLGGLGARLRASCSWRSPTRPARHRLLSIGEREVALYDPGRAPRSRHATRSSSDVRQADRNIEGRVRRVTSGTRGQAKARTSGRVTRDEASC